jgi:hypothetical protein
MYLDFGTCCGSCVVDVSFLVPRARLKSVLIHKHTVKDMSSRKQGVKFFEKPFGNDCYVWSRFRFPSRVMTIQGPLVNQLPVSGFFGFVVFGCWFVFFIRKALLVDFKEDHCLNIECRR